MAEKRSRSPGYPCISLPAAILKAKSIFDAEGIHAGDSLTMVKALGYSSLSGTSKVVLSAVKKYGLLESVDGNYKLSNLAIDILTGEDGSLEKSQALLEAATAPPIFADFYSEFGEDLPSEQNLQNRLLKKGFNASILDELLQAIYETWDLLRKEASNIKHCPKTRSVEPPKAEIEIYEGEEVVFSAAEPVQGRPLDGQNSDVAKPLVFRISKNNDAKIIFNCLPTQEAIAKLIALLDLSKDTYPTERDLEIY